MRPEHEICELGEYAEQLLRQEYFNAFCEEFEQKSVEYMLQTQPHETKKREAIYASLQGKRQLIELMLAYVAAREEIIKKSEQPTDAADDDYEPTT